MADPRLCLLKLDGDDIEIQVDEGVFVPTKTSDVLISALRARLSGRRRILDLGCGSGYVGLALARAGLVEGALSASDVSPAAIACCRRNAQRLGVVCEARVGSLFDCWEDTQFDLIVDDVSGVAEELARSSTWFPQFAPCGAGPDGTFWTREVLRRCRDYLAPHGALAFPAVSLSNEARILAEASEIFTSVETLATRYFPVTAEFGADFTTLEKLMEAGHIRLRRAGGQWIWWTSVYLAS